MAWKGLYMFRRDALKKIFDLGLFEFVDAEPTDVNQFYGLAVSMYLEEYIWVWAHGKGLEAF